MLLAFILGLPIVYWCVHFSIRYFDMKTKRKEIVFELE